MTAVQQYWIVENDAYLVSPLYPVVVRDDGVLIGNAPDFTGAAASLIDIFGTDAPPVAILDILVETFVAEWENGHDPDAVYIGAPPSVLSFSVATTSTNQYQNAQDTNQTYSAAAPEINSFSVVTVVVTYVNNMDTNQTYSASTPSINSFTVSP